MSKKSLIYGLESLFDEPADNFKDKSPLLQATDNGVSKSNSKHIQTKKRSKTSKSFTSNLDLLFKDNFSLNEVQPIKKSSTSKSSKIAKKRKNNSNSKPLFGLDALIRSTINQMSSNDKASTIKRLTLSLNKDQIKELKLVAKEQNKYVSQLVGELVDEYMKKIKL